MLGEDWGTIWWSLEEFRGLMLGEGGRDFSEEGGGESRLLSRSLSLILSIGKRWGRRRVDAGFIRRLESRVRAVDSNSTDAGELQLRGVLTGEATRDSLE